MVDTKGGTHYLTRLATGRFTALKVIQEHIHVSGVVDSGFRIIPKSSCNSSREYFDHIETLVNDVATFLLNDPNILKEVKAELRQTAKDVAEDTEGDVETTMKNLFMDNIQSPIKNLGEGRELKVSQRMFKYQREGEELQRNEFQYCDEDSDPVDSPSLERGCCLAPVLDPQVYILANGTAGIKLGIDLVHPIRISDQLGFLAEGEHRLQRR